MDASGAVTDEATFATEETWEIRPVSDGLVVPYVDPSGGNEATGHYARYRAGAWEVDLPLAAAFTDTTPEHVFTAAQTADGLWFAGSAYGAHPETGGAACIWRSTDDGVTFTASLLLDGAGLTGFARFYLLVPIGDEIIAVLGDTSGQRQFRWAGTAWTEETAPAELLTDYVAGSVTDGPFALAWNSGKSSGEVNSGAPHVLTRTVDASIAASVTPPPTLSEVVDAKLAPSGTIYAIGSMGRLHRFIGGAWADPVQFSGVSSVRSMSVDETGGLLYFTTVDSKVLTAPIPT